MDTSKTTNQSLAPPMSTDNSQPSVRVMRLYKPCLPLTSTLPPLNDPTDGTPFAISPNFMLPDSFGEIFVGETFSAYVAVVGSDAVFHHVKVSVKLQTANATVDLVQQSPQASNSSYANILNLNQYVDLVVQSRLSESGSHTLRVIVDYVNNRNEVKILKKFYRFNVVDPLSITHTISEIRDTYLIQFKIMNQTKLALSVENATFIPADESIHVNYIDKIHDKYTTSTTTTSTTPISHVSLCHQPQSSHQTTPTNLTTTTTKFSSNTPKTLNPSPEQALAQLLSSYEKLYPILQPNETYAYSIIIHKKQMNKDLLTLSNITNNTMAHTSTTSTAGSQGVNNIHFSDINHLLEPFYLGYPSIEWSVSMGENGSIRGRDIIATSQYIHQISLICLSCPGSINIYETFMVTIRMMNRTEKPIHAVLVCHQNDLPKPYSSNSTTNSNPITTSNKNATMTQPGSVYKNTSSTLFSPSRNSSSVSLSGLLNDPTTINNTTVTTAATTTINNANMINSANMNMYNSSQGTVSAPSSSMNVKSQMTSQLSQQQLPTPSIQSIQRTSQMSSSSMSIGYQNVPFSDVTYSGINRYSDMSTTNVNTSNTINAPSTNDDSTNTTKGIYVVGLSQQDLGLLPSGTYIDITMSLYPILRGVQHLNTLRVFDRLSGTIYDIHESICSVHVVGDEPSHTSDNLSKSHKSYDKLAIMSNTSTEIQGVTNQFDNLSMVENSIIDQLTHSSKMTNDINTISNNDDLMNNNNNNNMNYNMDNFASSNNDNHTNGDNGNNDNEEVEEEDDEEEEEEEESEENQILNTHLLLHTLHTMNSARDRNDDEDHSRINTSRQSLSETSKFYDYNTNNINELVRHSLGEDENISTDMSTYDSKKDDFSITAMNNSSLNHGHIATTSSHSHNSSAHVSTRVNPTTTTTIPTSHVSIKSTSATSDIPDDISMTNVLASYNKALHSSSMDSDASIANISLKEDHK